MKRFIVLLSALFCLSFAQDIAGSWTLTGVDVFYYNFARPNVATAGEAYAAMDKEYHTPLFVSDTYGLGASLPIAWLPPGYMFLAVPNGPFGEGGLAANGVNLNVTLYTDGTGMIPEGSTYPDIELDESSCITFGQVLPVTDEIVYSSDADAGATLPLTNINGQPSRNPYAGEAMGTMSLSQSVVFSFFPQTAVPDVSPWLLFFDAETPAVYPVADENGNYPSLGVTGGWIKTDGFTGSIGDADPLSSDQPEPDLALYWHTMDGFSADTGLGDELGVDEDGDGTDFDRIFGLPAISATRIDQDLAAGFGFGTDFDRLVAGDITGPLGDLVYAGCIDTVVPQVSAQCAQVLAGGIAQATATCQSYESVDTTGGDGLFVVLYAGCLGDCFDPTGVNDTCTSEEHAACAGVAGQGVGMYGSCENWAAAYVGGGPGGAAGATVTYLADTIVAAMDPPLYESCLGAAASAGGDEALAVAGVTNSLCLGAGFDQENCDDLVALVTGDYGITDCTALDANSGALTSAAAGLVESTDEDESGDNCGEWALSVADGFAAQSAETGYLTCTDLAAATVASGTVVTTTDDYEDAEMANEIYVMNPDPNFALWNQFVTFNAYMYGETSDPSYLVADYDHNLDFSTAYFISAATGLACDPTSGDPYCAIPVAPGTDGILGTADDGGRIVFKYNPTCVPVVESMEVQTEFVGFAEGECTHDGDVDGNSDINVLDVVALVQYVIGNATLTDDESCRADINSDSEVNVLDVVAIVQSIVNSRGESATSAEFSRTSNGLEMTANGVVDAVQMTLSHGNDFIIDLTDNAFVAEYNTVDNKTTLMVVLPEEGSLFTSTGEYTIDEVIAANADGYIETSMPVSFNLSDAYPNPFNPSTNLDIELSYESSVSVMVYNVMGQMVSVLHDGNMSAGMHSITWDASDLSSGMYIIKAEVANEVTSQKVMLVK